MRALAAFAAVAALVGGIPGLDAPHHGGSPWDRRRRSGMPGHASDGGPHLHATERARRARQAANAVRNAERLAAHDTGPHGAFVLGPLRSYGQLVFRSPNYVTMPREMTGRERARARRAFARRWRS